VSQLGVEVGVQTERAKSGSPGRLSSAQQEEI